MTTMSNLAAYAPTAYDLLHRVGLERRRSRTLRAASRAGWLGLGMAVGSGLFMFFNSRTGPEVRERLADTARRAREYVAPSDGEEQSADTTSQPSASRSSTSTSSSTRRV
jgi:hypothetical protein